MRSASETGETCRKELPLTGSSFLLRKIFPCQNLSWADAFLLAFNTMIDSCNCVADSRRPPCLAGLSSRHPGFYRVKP